MQVSCCPRVNIDRNNDTPIKNEPFKEKEEIYFSIEETFSTDNTKNLSSVNSSNNQLADIKLNENISPKFNDKFCSHDQRKDLFTFTGESRRYDNSSYKYSEFTFNNGKDKSLCNFNTNVIESLNSSRVK